MTGLVASAALPRIPWSRIGIAVGILAFTALFAGYKIEERRADRLDKQLTSYRVALGQARMEAGRLKAEGIRIANEEKARHEKELAALRSAAADLRLSGPGAARCAPVIPAAPRPGISGGIANDGRPEVSPDDRAAVPWNWLVNRAESHDALRLEVLSWRRWYADLNATWGKKK